MTIKHAVENLRKHLQDGGTIYLVIRRTTTNGHAVSVYTGGDIRRITGYVAVAGGFKTSRDGQSLIVNGGCSYIVDAIEAATGLKDISYRILT